MATEYIGTGNDDGVNFGRTDDLIGFYGLATPIVKPSFTNAAVPTTASSSATLLWAWTTSTQTSAIVALANDLRAQLVALGLITT